MGKPARNDTCPCGSGKKHKKCCQARVEETAVTQTSARDVGPAALKVVSKRATLTSEETNQLAVLLASGRHAELEIEARSLTDRYPDFGLIWNVLGASLQAQGKHALPAFKKAAELAPEVAETHANLGDALLFSGQADAAAASYRRALHIKPDFAEAHCNLGNALLACGQLEDAVANCRRALKIRPDFAEAHCNLGNAFQALGQRDDAVGCYRRALKIKPDFAEALTNLGNALRASGRLDEAVESCRAALRIRPDFAEAHNNLGDALQASGQFDEAVMSYRQALAIAPDFAEAHNNLGNALRTSGQLDEAVASCRRALAIKPDFADAHSNLGNALLACGRMDEAVASCRRALAIKPDFADAFNNLGAALQASGQLDEALASCRQALTIKPDSVEAHVNLGNALQVFGQFDFALASYRRALAIQPDFADARCNMLLALNYHPGASDAEILAACAEYEAKFGAPCRAAWQPHLNNREPGGRLKIGYVSPDFRRHALAYFAEPIFANRDHSRVEIICYSEVEREDDYTGRFRSLADHWHRTVGMSDDAMARLIREHQVDILVDLAGHSARNRLRVFARKPAPVQVTYLGYPATTGLSAMDYRITDSHADPVGNSESRYVEHLIRLPDSLWCYRPPADMPEPTPLPALSHGYVTYGSFNNFNKIDLPTVDLWAALLREQPGARMMFVTVPEGVLREQLQRRFVDRGVDAGRLSFYGKLPLAEYHRKILEADIALDPVIVNGGTTTCESLWLGAPVLSLTGERFLSRAGLSLLKTAGLPELACATAEDYLQTAAKLAHNLPQLAEIRSGLRAKMAASPLTDGAAFARNLEAAYRQIWTRWCAPGDRSPASARGTAVSSAFAASAQ
jgi:protein O-GlcNAc transferase